MDRSPELARSAASNLLRNGLVVARKFANRHNLLLYSYCLFISSYYFAPNERVFKSIFYYGVFLLFLITMRSDDLRFIRRSLVFRLAMLWLGYLALSLFWSDAVELKDIEKVVRGFLWIGVFLSVTIILSRQERLFPQQLFVTVAVVAAATAVIAMAIFYSTHEFPRERLIGIGQLSRHALAAGIFYGAAFVMTAFGPLAQSQTAQSRLLYGVLLAILGAALVLTASRGPMLGAGLSVLVGLMAARRWAMTALVAGLGLAAIIVVAVTAVVGGSGIGELDFIARGSGHRLVIWSNILGHIRETFWIGNGIATDMPVTFAPNGNVFKTAHQMFLANHFYGGVPATLLLLALLAAAARAAYLRIRTNGDVVYAALLVFLLVVSNIYFDKVIKSANLEWFYIWLPLALVAGQDALISAKSQQEDN